jgi:teichuronic acid biosynthesis glycosyltransferase TuaC
MKPLLLTFTNLFPNSVMPTHGIFVKERMQRVAAAMGDVEWRVVAPIPRAPWFLRTSSYRRWLTVPELEFFDGVVVHHPRFAHWPGISVGRQANAVVAAGLDLVRELVGLRPAVLDAHYIWPDGVAAAEIAERLGIPFVLTARGTDVNLLANVECIRRRISVVAPKAWKRLAVSRALADRFADAAGMPRESVEVARNGVDMNRFRPGDSVAARKALGLPVDARIVLGVGRQVPSKGFRVAAQAVAGLGEGVRLVLVGEGPERSAIEAAGKGRVIFLGPRSPDEVAEACRAADVLTLPSEREGWPNVVTEAIASGLRVVATPVGGIPEILGNPPPKDGSLGVLVPWNDVAALQRALSETLAKPADPARVRRHAEQFGWDPPVQQLESAFRTALATSCARHVAEGNR